MNFAAATLVGLTLGQPPAPPEPAYYPMTSRKIRIPIKYERDRKQIRQVFLYVARNGENTWYQEVFATPDRDAFAYVAKDDGVYWFTIVEEDLRGQKTPADLTRTPPDLKVLVDTVAPRVQFTTAKRHGEEVVVEWAIDDKNPDENNTKVHFRPAGTDGYWQEVSLPAGSKAGVRFPAGTAGAVTVRVTAFDLAGNKTEGVRDIGTNAASGQTSTSMSPGSPAVPPPGPAAPVAPPGGGGGAPIPPPDSLVPRAPVGPPPASPPPGAGAEMPVVPVQPYTPTPASPANPAPPPLATVDPRQPVVPATPPAAASAGGPTPVAVWNGVPAGGPTIEVSRAQVVGFLAFDLGYDVESRGPSGISRLDLWVTRDDGRTWLKWSQHDGKAASVRVNLNVPANPHPEGAYGFRVVPVSGAGLSEREPAAGDAPDLRVVVDVTPPHLDLFPPTGDPASPDTLVIPWKATDKNFGEAPITIEWADKPSGPWQPVAAAGEVVQAQATAPQARRLPNTGQYAWRVPAGLPPRVYLKVSARDAAGNVREVVTRDPILVDLVKPRAKISGIVPPRP